MHVKSSAQRALAGQSGGGGTGQDGRSVADAIGVTSAQPYQGRHSAPDADADDAPRSPAGPAPAGTSSQVATVTRPSLPPHLATVLAHHDDGRSSETAMPGPDAWIDYAPPHELAPKRAMWEVPAGFVPMKPPRTRSLRKTLGWIVVLALVGGLGWFGYRVFTQPKPKLHTIETPA